MHWIDNNADVKIQSYVAYSYQLVFKLNCLSST